jgi:hypothetical protein
VFAYFGHLHALQIYESVKDLAALDFAMIEDVSSLAPFAEHYLLSHLLKVHCPNSTYSIFGILLNRKDRMLLQ